jgi:hypothetical protein
MVRHAEQTQGDCYDVLISLLESFVTWGKKPTASGKKATISAYWKSDRIRQVEKARGE